MADPRKKFRQMVSLKKKRYQDEEFDLDLACSLLLSFPSPILYFLLLFYFSFHSLTFSRLLFYFPTKILYQN